MDISIVSQGEKRYAISRLRLKEKVQDYMRSQSGTHFDPQVIELFLSMMND